MSDDTQSNDSTESNQRIVVAPTGAVTWGRYTDTDAIVERAIGGVRRLAGGSLEGVTVVVKNDYSLMQALEDEPTVFDVEYYSLDWRQLLDDGYATDEDGEIHVDDNGEPVTRAIKSDDDPAAEEFVDGEVPSDFSLNNRDHRSLLNFGDDGVPEARIKAAKEKARLVASERLINEFHDYPEGEADGVVLLHDGTNRKIPEVQAFQGTNRYVVNPERLDGDMLQANLNQSDDRIINWTLYMLQSDRSDLTVDDLTDAQKEALREEESEETLTEIGIEPASEGVPEPVSAD